MCAVIALRRRMSLRVDVQRVVRTGLHTCLATNAATVVEINDSIGAAEQRCDGTDFDTWSVVAMVASHDRKVATGIRELSLFDVLNPGSIHSNRDIMFRFAGDGTGVAADTSSIVDDETKIDQRHAA